MKDPDYKMMNFEGADARYNLMEELAAKELSSKDPLRRKPALKILEGVTELREINDPQLNGGNRLK